MLNKEITINDVLEFIREHGNIYDYDIYRELEKLENPKITTKEVINRRKSMYERLSKL